MDETDFKTLEAGKVDKVLMSFAPALKKIRFGCAKMVWDARRKKVVASGRKGIVPCLAGLRDHETATRKKMTNGNHGRLLPVYLQGAQQRF